ncbi:MAG TPA: response regulator [Polyangiales bacterium]|jgi:two-component system chemotaxis response regulator CheY|nr:response regulator [Polyangiales bacterium]
MRALVLDDSRAIRSIVGKIMKELGFDVLEASNGREGLERLAASDGVDVALVDWNMPEMNGLEFVRSVRQNAAYNGVRLVMITTESEISQMTLALSSGAEEYIMKPFDKAMVVQKLEILGIGGSA